MDNHRVTFLALSKFLHHHLLWFLLSAYAIAAVFPSAGLWIRNITFGDIPISQTKIHVSLFLLLLATISDVQNRLLLTRCDDREKSLIHQTHPLPKNGRGFDLPGCGNTISAQQDFDRLHVCDKKRIPLQDNRAR